MHMRQIADMSQVDRPALRDLMLRNFVLIGRNCTMREVRCCLPTAVDTSAGLHLKMPAISASGGRRIADAAPGNLRCQARKSSGIPSTRWATDPPEHPSSRGPEGDRPEAAAQDAAVGPFDWVARAAKHLLIVLARRFPMSFRISRERYNLKVRPKPRTGGRMRQRRTLDAEQRTCAHLGPGGLATLYVVSMIGVDHYI